MEAFFFLGNNYKINFSGVYDNWKDARNNSKGYEDHKILKRVQHTTSLLLSKKRAYERDGILLNKNEYPSFLMDLIFHLFQPK